jgi:hypothetical protein
MRYVLGVTATTSCGLTSQCNKTADPLLDLAGCNYPVCLAESEPAHNFGLAALTSRKVEDVRMARKFTTPPEWSQRRTRHNPPDLDEAITAAQGLTDDIDSQVEIAAQLMGLLEDEVRPPVLKVLARSRIRRLVSTPMQPLARGAVMIERRSPRPALTRAGHRR